MKTFLDISGGGFPPFFQDAPPPRGGSLRLRPKGSRLGGPASDVCNKLSLRGAISNYSPLVHPFLSNSVGDVPNIIGDISGWTRWIKIFLHNF